MTPAALIEKDMPPELQLRGLAKQIRAASQDVETGMRALQKASCSCVSDAAICGALLIKAKALCRHGEFIPWVELNTGLSRSTTSRYMRVANYWDAHPEIQGAQSIHAALALCAPEPEAATGDGKEQEKTPASRLVERAGGLAKAMEKIRPEELDGDSILALAARLEPLAAMLWPSRFSRPPALPAPPPAGSLLGGDGPGTGYRDRGLTP